MKKFFKKLAGVIHEFVIVENPVFTLLLGLCPMLAASTSLLDACVMGVVATITLILSALIVRGVLKLVPESVRLVSVVLIPITIIAAFEILIRAFLPSVFESIGMYLPLLAVSGIVIYGYNKQRRLRKLSSVVKKATALGTGFFAATFIMAFFREFFGRGSLFGFQIFPEEYGVLILTYPAGGLILLGVFIALFRALFFTEGKKEEKK